MGRFFDRHIKKSKVNHQCYRCKKIIEIGLPYHIITYCDHPGAFRESSTYCDACYIATPPEFKLNKIRSTK